MRKTSAAAAAVALILAAACNREAPPPVEQEQTMEAPQQRSDSELVTAVRGQLFADRGVRASDVDVSASGGVITLSGEVNSNEVKERAVVSARAVNGVTRVEDRLQVAQPRADADRQQTQQPAGTSAANSTNAAARSGDAWVTTKILAQYFVTPDVKPWNIDVSTTGDGMVTLEGEVPSARARDEAERVARTTEGVRQVENRLRIRGEGQEQAARDQQGQQGAAADVDQPDVWVTTKVHAKYFMDDDVKGTDIDVTTENGVVTLSGTVSSASERRQAVTLARNTDGVREVRDNLRVQAASAASDRDSTVATSGRAGEPGATLGEQVDDGWITTKLQASYYLDTDVRGRSIDVTTRNGVVVLEGRVNSAAEKQTAEEIARDIDGVRRVDNRLMVSGG